MESLETLKLYRYAFVVIHHECECWVINKQTNQFWLDVATSAKYLNTHVDKIMEFLDRGLVSKDHRGHVSLSDLFYLKRYTQLKKEKMRHESSMIIAQLSVSNL
jgi:hypothetical protein